MYTAVVALSKFTGQYGFDTPWGTIMAAGVILTVPLIIGVLIFQRRRRGQREPRHAGVLAGGADKGIFFLSHDRHPATPSGAPGMGAFPIPLVLRTTSGPSLSLGFIVVGNSLPSRAAGPR